MTHNSQHGPSPAPSDNADAIGLEADWVRVGLDGKLAKVVGGVVSTAELYDPVEGFEEDGDQIGGNIGRELMGASASVGVSAVAGVYGGPLSVLAAAPPLSELAEAGVEKVFELIPTADDYSKAFTALAAQNSAPNPQSPSPTPGNDSLEGGLWHANTLSGGVGNDVLHGGWYNDLLIGEADGGGHVWFAAGLAGEGAFEEHIPLDPGAYLLAAQQDIAPAAYPYSAVVLLLITFPNGLIFAGSGVMVGRNDVLTASHVVYNPAWGGAATSVVATPAAVPGPPFQAPYGQHPAIITYVDTQVDPNNDRIVVPGNRGPGFVGSERDMAFLTLRTPIGDRTGWMDLDPTFKQGYANLSGYPAPGFRQTNDVELAKDNPLDAFTDITNFEAHFGNSGGPLWHYGSNGRPAVVGIVSSGINGKGVAAYDISTNYASILGWIASNDNLIA